MLERCKQGKMSNTKMVLLWDSVMRKVFQMHTASFFPEEISTGHQAQLPLVVWEKEEEKQEKMIKRNQLEGLRKLKQQLRQKNSSMSNSIKLRSNSVHKTKKKRKSGRHF